MFRGRNLLSVMSVLAVAACAESSTTALAPVSANASARSDVGCIATSTVATTEAQLHAMLAAAQSGDVVAVSGMIEMSVDAARPRAGTKLTCVAPGDGLSATPGLFNTGTLIEILEPNVTVQGLTLLSNGIASWPIYVERSDFVFNGAPVNGVNARVLGNTVECGGAGCVFLVGSAGSIAADNAFTSNGSSSGIHIQGSGLGQVYRTDGIQILRNRIVTTTNSGAPSFGAIRPRDGSDMVLRDNVIVGPWSNGIATTTTLNATLERNSVDAATRYGIFVGTTTASDVQVRGLLARNNTLNGAQHAIFVNRACTNVFVANKMSTPSGTPVFFTTTTGANNLLGGDNSVNVDNGNVDCDGDGSVDPNFLTGRKKAGTEQGETMQAVMPPSRRVTMQ